MPRTTQNTAVFPQVDGGRAPGKLAPSTVPGAHNLYAYRPAYRGTVASNLASAAYLTSKEREAQYKAIRKAVKRRRLFIRANHVVLACALFWLAVAWVWAAPEAVPLLNGPGFETCMNGSC